MIPASGCSPARVSAVVPLPLGSGTNSAAVGMGLRSALFHAAAQNLATSRATFAPVRRFSLSSSGGSYLTVLPQHRRGRVATPPRRLGFQSRSAARSRAPSSASDEDVVPVRRPRPRAAVVRPRGDLPAHGLARASTIALARAR